MGAATDSVRNRQEPKTEFASKVPASVLVSHPRAGALGPADQAPRFRRWVNSWPQVRWCSSSEARDVLRPVRGHGRFTPRSQRANVERAGNRGTMVASASAAESPALSSLPLVPGLLARADVDRLLIVDGTHPGEGLPQGTFVPTTGRRHASDHASADKMRARRAPGGHSDGRTTVEKRDGRATWSDTSQRP
jgi:hypothetical protein